jgi:hypothetical protein
MAAYMNGGGSWTDIGKLKMTAMGTGITSIGCDEIFDPLAYMAGTAKTDGETIELTSELLADAIKIAHPDLHPSERRDLAHRVTQGLIALQPFTFPAEKPKPVPPSGPPAPSTTTKPAPSSGTKTRYPCTECAPTIPFYYCTECKTEWDSRRKKERERESATRRRQYLRRKNYRMFQRPPKLCPCGLNIKSKRKDARFCSDKCRQKAHRELSRIKEGLSETSKQP